MPRKLAVMSTIIDIVDIFGFGYFNLTITFAEI